MNRNCRPIASCLLLVASGPTIAAHVSQKHGARQIRPTAPLYLSYLIVPHRRRHDKRKSHSDIARRCGRPSYKRSCSSLPLLRCTWRLRHNTHLPARATRVAIVQQGLHLFAYDSSRSLSCLRDVTHGSNKPPVGRGGELPWEWYRPRQIKMGGIAELNGGSRLPESPSIRFR